MCHFDVASGPFKWLGGALKWPCSTLKNPFRTLKKKKQKESIKPIECSEWLAGVNVSVCGDAEVPEEQAGK